MLVDKYGLKMNIFAIALVISLCLLLASPAITSPYVSYYNQSRSDQVGLYSSSTPLTLDINHLYTVSYSHPITSGSSQLMFSFSKLHTNSNFAISYIRLKQQSKNLVSFSLVMRNAGLIQVYQLSVSYLAFADQLDNIYIVSQEYGATDLPNLSSGDGPRSQTITGSLYSYTSGNTLNSDNSFNFAAAFLNGFEIQAIEMFELSVQISTVNSISVNIVISTKSTCRIFMANLLYVFIDKEAWESVTDVSFYSQKFEYSNSLAINSNNPLLNPGDGSWILGMTNLTGDVTDTSLTLQFTYSLDSSSSLDVSNEGSQLSKIGLQLIYLASLECPNSHPYFVDSAKQLCTTGCQSSQTSTPTFMICQVCSSPCSTCISGASECSSCINGYELEASSNTCKQIEVSNPPVETSRVPLYLLSLLVIPIIAAAIGVYYCLRKKTTKFKIEDIRTQPSVDII